MPEDRRLITLDYHKNGMLGNILSAGHFDVPPKLGKWIRKLNCWEPSFVGVLPTYSSSGKNVRSRIDCVLNTRTYLDVSLLIQPFLIANK